MTAPIAAVPSVWAQCLGYAGLLPFVFLAIATWVVDPSHRALTGLALTGYGAVIASFLGAVHWGLVMRDGSKQSAAQLGWGVMPSLLAWLGFLLNPAPGLLLIAALLWVCFAVDRVVYPRFQAQGWLPMRLTLTSIASVSCIAGAAKLYGIDSSF